MYMLFCYYVIVLPFTNKIIHSFIDSNALMYMYECSTAKYTISVLGRKTSLMDMMICASNYICSNSLLLHDRVWNAVFLILRWINQLK